MERVKVELHQKNFQSVAMPAALEIRSNEPILQTAGDYDVSLLKYTTAFNVPILHISESDPLEFFIFNGNGSFRKKFTMSELYRSIGQFVEEFNNMARFTSYGRLSISKQLSYNGTSGDMTCIDKPTYEVTVLGFTKRTADFLTGVVRMGDWEDPNFQNYNLAKVMYINGSHSTGSHEQETIKNADVSRFYNFDYIQLGTDLPIAQTLTTIRGRSDGSPVSKMPTLGTITTNSAVQNAYAEGGLLYLPNFQISTSLESDLPLYGFKITPYLFYKSGHYERLVLTPESTCYAYIEFTPR